MSRSWRWPLRRQLYLAAYHAVAGGGRIMVTARNGDGARRQNAHISIEKSACGMKRTSKSEKAWPYNDGGEIKGKPAAQRI